MKTESKTANVLHLLWDWCKKARNAIVLVILFPLYHLYDGLCYIVANAFGFINGSVIMFAILFPISVGVVYLHAFCKKKYGWDMLAIGKVNELMNREIEIPRHKIFKRFMAWLFQKGGFLAIYLVVPIIFGPFISAIILRKNSGLRQNLLYIIPGSLLSAVFWVSLYVGIGFFTWKKYILPFYCRIVG